MLEAQIRKDFQSSSYRMSQFILYSSISLTASPVVSSEEYSGKRKQTEIENKVHQRSEGPFYLPSNLTQMYIRKMANRADCNQSLN